MKRSNDIDRSAHPLDTDQYQTSSQLKSLDESYHQVCPYCVNSEISESSENSSPTILPLVTGNRDLHLNCFDFELSAQAKDTFHSGYKADASSYVPSSLNLLSSNQSARKSTKMTSVPKMPCCSNKKKIASGSRMTNSSDLAVTKSTASLRNESDKSSYTKSLSQTVAPSLGKSSVKNSTHSTSTNASSVMPFSESAYRQPASLGFERIYPTRQLPNFYNQHTGSTKQRSGSKRQEGYQSSMNDPVSTHHQATNNRSNLQSSSTSYEPATNSYVGTQPGTTSKRVGILSTSSDHLGNSQPLSSQSEITSIEPTNRLRSKTTRAGLTNISRSEINIESTNQPKFETIRTESTNQPTSEQPYRTVKSQHSDNESALLPSQSATRPTHKNPSTLDPAVKPVFQQLETKKPIMDSNEKSKLYKTERTVAPAISEIESQTEVESKGSHAKVEFSKLQTGSPETTSSSRPYSNDEEASYADVHPQITTRRPMPRSTNSTLSESTCAPDDFKKSENQPPAEHVEKSSGFYTSRPAQFVLRQYQSTSKQPVPAKHLPTPAKRSTTKSSHPGQQPATRPVWNRNANSSLSIEDVGVDGSRAFIIRKERRGKIDWRRKPRFKVKQTTTSRLRYGYWFADCGRQRVKAYRGDWSQIPPELLRDWEVYQNYFRYRVKGRRKRTSSLVRKFIAGKYRQKKIPPSQKRPIRKMSPLLPSKPSPPPQDVADSYSSDQYATGGAGLAGVEDDSSDIPHVGGSNVHGLLMRRAQAQLRLREPGQQRVAHLARPVDVYRKPQILVRSTVTSRLRKSSTMQPCSKPVTPTLWHGSSGEMEDLKQKIAHRRQRLKDTWLKQISAKEQNSQQITGLMGHLMVVGIPLNEQLGTVSSECANVVHKNKGRKFGKIEIPTPKSEKQRNGLTYSARTAQNFIKLQLPAIPETDWSTSSSQSDTSAGTVAPVYNFHQPSSMAHESSMPVINSQNHTKKKKKSFIAVRKVLNMARWLIAPAIHTKQNSTPAMRPEIIEKS